MNIKNMVIPLLAVALNITAMRTEADPLAPLNQTVREIYGEARQVILTNFNPILILEGDNIVLYWRGGVERIRYTPSSYHSYKALSHMALGIFGAVGPASLGLNDYNWREAIVRLSDATEAARPDVENLIQASPDRDLLSNLWGQLGDYVRAAQAAPNPPTRDELRAFGMRVAPLLLSVASRTAEAQIAGLHDAAGIIRANLGDANWNAAMVVVTGPSTAREGNLQFQYFTRLLGSDAIGRRLLFAENIFDAEGALRLVGVHLVDRKVGEIFFGQGARMERDLLSDAATFHLLRLFGAVGPDTGQTR